MGTTFAKMTLEEFKDLNVSIAKENSRHQLTRWNGNKRNEE
jgi:hypothetical protein